jgi:hypothetical protein
MNLDARFSRIDAAIIGALAEFFGVEPAEIVEWVEDKDPQSLAPLHVAPMP